MFAIRSAPEHANVANSLNILSDDLRRRIARLERLTPQRTAAIPFGISDIDETLPAKGLLLGALHEVAGRDAEVEHGAAAALMIAGVLARLKGPVLWVAERRDLFAPGLAAVGLAPARVLHIEAGKQVLLAMEDGLRCAGLAGVVGEIDGTLGLTPSRRLQLAAETSGVIGFALRRSRQFQDKRLDEPTAAVTRWRVGCVPSPPPLAHAPDTPGLGPAMWRLDLVRARGGVPGQWIVEACDDQGRLKNCRPLAADLADRPAAQSRDASAA
jgi:protein ImuA